MVSETGEDLIGVVVAGQGRVTRSMLSAVAMAGPKYDSLPDRTSIADERAIRVIEAVRDLDPVAAIEELKN